jgi:hypothetical protein
VTDVMILKIFSPKKSAKKLAFLTQNKAKLCKNLIITLFFEKNANFLTENCRKSQKIVIITSTPDEFLKSHPTFLNVTKPIFGQNGYINFTAEKSSTKFRRLL